MAKRKARTITVTAATRILQTLRRQQSTPAFRSVYRLRVVVEHRLARLCQLGIRQARYFGRAKTAFQLAMAAAVANLSLAITHLGSSSVHLWPYLTAFVAVLAFCALRSDSNARWPRLTADALAV